MPVEGIEESGSYRGWWVGSLVILVVVVVAAVLWFHYHPI